MLRDGFGNRPHFPARAVHRAWPVEHPRVALHLLVPTCRRQYPSGLLGLDRSRDGPFHPLPGAQRRRPSASLRKAGDHLGLFEACSSFTSANRRTRIAFLRAEYSDRSFRAGKTVISAEQSVLFGQLSSTADNWRLRLEKPRQAQMLGRDFTAK